MSALMMTMAFQLWTSMVKKYPTAVPNRDPRLNASVITLWGSSRLLFGSFPTNPSATVKRNPAPHPWTMRKAIIISTDSAMHRPIAPPKNSVAPMMMSSFGPSLSIRAPAMMTTETSAMMYAESSQLAMSEPV